MDLNLQQNDIVICALSGDYGKPRPAVVVQSNLFNETHASVTICPITTHLIEAPFFRLLLKPNVSNGLKIESQIMVDKITTLARDKIRQKVGVISKTDQQQLEHAIRLWLNLKK